MALSATISHPGIAAKLARPFQAVLNGIGWFFVQSMENNSRLRQVDYLSSLSDDELADRGLTRDRIVHHVFKDVMGI